MSVSEFKISEIRINGFHNRPIPNRYFRLNKESETISIVFPGLYYSCDMPLLYYTTRILLTHNVDVLQLWSNYADPSFQALGSSERSNWLEEDALAVYQQGIRQREYKQSLLVGKSLGTLSLASLLDKNTAVKIIAIIWLTPLLHTLEVSKKLHSLQIPALYIGGDRDPTFEASYLRPIKENPKGKILIIEGANHSLEIPGNVPLSLQIMETVTRQISDFLNHPSLDLAQ